MNPTHAAALLRSMSGLASRRGIIGGLASGLLATGIVPVNADDAEARKKGKKKRKKQNKKRKNTKQSTRADATCPSANPIDPAASGQARLAQTFTAERSGSLVSAQLDINRGLDSVGDYILRLSPVDGAGIPTNEVLATAFVANGDVPDGASAVTFTFANPANVDAGTQYALVLARPGQDNFTWLVRTGDPCLGQRFISLSPTAPFEASLGTDYIYTAFVRS
jgi:hypothetical protein